MFKYVANQKLQNSQILHKKTQFPATHVIARWVLIGGGLDGVGHEAQDGSDPQQQGEAHEQLLTELDPLGGGLGG